MAAPVVGWAILAGHPTLAISLFAYAAVTDLVDGFIARHFKQESVVGTIIDPMADKFLMTVGVVCLSLQNAIPREFYFFFLHHSPKQNRREKSMLM